MQNLLTSPAIMELFNEFITGSTSGSYFIEPDFLSTLCEAIPAAQETDDRSTCRDSTPTPSTGYTSRFDSFFVPNFETTDELQTGGSILTENVDFCQSVSKHGSTTVRDPAQGYNSYHELNQPRQLTQRFIQDSAQPSKECIYGQQLQGGWTNQLDTRGDLSQELQSTEQSFGIYILIYSLVLIYSGKKY